MKAYDFNHAGERMYDLGYSADDAKDTYKWLNDLPVNQLDEIFCDLPPIIGNALVVAPPCPDFFKARDMLLELRQKQRAFDFQTVKKIAELEQNSDFMAKVGGYDGIKTLLQKNNRAP